MSLRDKLQREEEPRAPIYDDGESYAAGDEDMVQFENDRLIALIAVVQALIPDPEHKRLIRLAILSIIFGETEDT